MRVAQDFLEEEEQALNGKYPTDVKQGTNLMVGAFAVNGITSSNVGEIMKMRGK